MPPAFLEKSEVFVLFSKSILTNVDILAIINISTSVDMLFYKSILTNVDMLAIINIATNVDVLFCKGEILCRL